MTTETSDVRRDGRPGIDRLWDSQWVNIVNSPEVLEAMGFRDCEEAVNIAVRMTEQAMAKNFAAAPPPIAPVGVRNAILEALNLVHAEGRARVESATAEMADRLAALAQQPAAVDGAMVDRFIRKYQELEPGDDVPAVDDPETRRFAETLLTAALAAQHQEPTT